VVGGYSKSLTRETGVTVCDPEWPLDRRVWCNATGSPGTKPDPRRGLGVQASCFFDSPHPNIRAGYRGPVRQGTGRVLPWAWARADRACYPMGSKPQDCGWAGGVADVFAEASGRGPLAAMGEAVMDGR